MYMIKHELYMYMFQLTSSLDKGIWTTTYKSADGYPTSYYEYLLDGDKLVIVSNITTNYTHGNISGI